MALTKIDDRGLKTPIDLLDNEKIRFGTGNDLELYHDASHSRIKDTGTGYLIINTDTGVLIKNGADDEGIAYFTPNGAVELMYDNSKKLQTQSGGVRVFGDLENHNDDFVAKDNCKFTAGNSADLQIYHDGSDNFIDTFWNLTIRKDNGAETLAKFTNNGAVELYYDNVKKLETTSSGVDMMGSGVNTVKITGTSGHELYSYSDTGGVGWCTGAGAGNYGELIYFDETNGNVYIYAEGEQCAGFKGNGASELFYDNSKKLETASYGVDIPDTLRLSGGWADYGTQMCLGCDSNGVAYTAAYALKFNTGANNSRTTILELDASNNATFAGQIKVAAGYGLHFGANSDTGRTVSSNVLDDYEEGSWTPLLESTGTAFTSNTNWSSNSRYTKIGRMVTIQCYQRSGGINKGSAASTDGIAITGLPFTPTNVVQRSMVPIGQNVNWAQDPNQALVRENIASVELYKYASSGSNNTGIPLTVADVGTAANNNYAIFTLTYESA